MNIIYFIRLLLRHALLLMTLPVVLGVMVFYMTQDEPKVYETSTQIYTGITTGSSITSLEKTKVDLFATNTAFDNLINLIRARSTIEEVSIELLARHLMLDKADSQFISKEKYDKLQEMVPDDVKALVVKGNLKKTIKNLVDYKNKDFSNFIYELVNYDHPDYSVESIKGKIKVRRVQSSDLIEISYSSNDPGICKQTLEILTDVFIRRYTQIKVNQSDAVVKYFEEQMKLATTKLAEAEQELLEFNEGNVIINYYEQTKHIAAEKEHFDMRYLELKLEYAGAESAIEALEKKMSNAEKQRITNDRIFKLRNELSKINIEIALKGIEEKRDSATEQALIEELGQLRTRAYEIEQELKEAISDSYALDNSTNGVPTNSVLQQWVDKVIELESAKAQIEVAKVQEKQFEKLFKAYAPLGANMKRLERKIDVAEREYLSLLHSLGIAKLNQQNEELNSGLNVITEPLYPIVAQPSKRKFMILVAMVLGFMLPAFVILAMDFLDQNIRSATRAQKMIGLEVAATFPKLVRFDRKLNAEQIKQNSISILVRRILFLRSKMEEEPRTKIFLFFSSLEGEGKTTLARFALRKLASLGYKVLFLTPHEVEPVEGAESIVYEADSEFFKIDNVEDLCLEANVGSIGQYDFVFVELPEALNSSCPSQLFQTCDQSFLIARANRSWSKADENVLKEVVEYAPRKPEIVLNGVEMLEMEAFIGELPKKRSFIRRLVKNIVMLRFGAKNDMATKSKRNKYKDLLS